MIKIFILTIFLPNLIFAQIINTLNVENIDSMYPFYICNVGDDAIIAYSTRLSNINGNQINLFRLNDKMQIKWEKQLESGYNNKVLGIINHNNDIVILNEFKSSKNEIFYEILCINIDGKLLWKKKYCHIIVDIMSTDSSSLYILFVKQKNKDKIENYNDVKLFISKITNQGEIIEEAEIGDALSLPMGGVETKIDKVNGSYYLFSRTIYTQKNDTLVCKQPSTKYPFFNYYVSFFDTTLTMNQKYKIYDCSNIFCFYMLNTNEGYYISRSRNYENNKQSDLLINYFNKENNEKWSRVISTKNGFSDFQLIPFKSNYFLILIADESINVSLIGLDGKIVKTLEINDSSNSSYQPMVLTFLNNKTYIIWKQSNFELTEINFKYKLIDWSCD